MKVFQRFVLPLLSGLLLYAAWPMSPFPFLIFFALVPLLYLNETTRQHGRYFYILYLNFFIWNAATTWWIWNASPGGAAGAIAANSLLMTLPWMLYRFTKRQVGDAWGAVSLILYWLTFEYIHHNWELSWPWLTLGNVFADTADWVQWYRYTGTTGGSLWVLLVNLLLFQAFPLRSFGVLSRPAPAVPVPHNIRRVAAVLALVLIPVLYSKLFFGLVPVKQYRPYNAIVVQPNVRVDPIHPENDEKFNTDPALLVAQLIRLSESRIDSSTRVVIWPETAIPVGVWENELLQNGYYQPLIAFVQRHPRLQLVTGIDSYRRFSRQEGRGRFSMRHDEGSDTYYEAYNTALGLDSRLQPRFYHKSKLVPGPESLPSWLGFLGGTFENLGGLSGSLGRSDAAVAFRSPGNPYIPAPVICYESIYSNYLTEYIRQGANLITIITNDGWWGNTPGYRQHESYARLRAIETGCWVARSANTGISCFIDPNGEVYQAQPWDTEAVIKMNIPVSDVPTFYARNGDYISRIVQWAAAGMLLSAVLAGFRRRKQVPPTGIH